MVVYVLLKRQRGQNAGLIFRCSVDWVHWDQLKLLIFLMNETKVFNDKRAIFLNPEQESETKLLL
jgi:hypothetical protein